jgi:hypothetical protein
MDGLTRRMSDDNFPQPAILYAKSRIVLTAEETAG